MKRLCRAAARAWNGYAPLRTIAAGGNRSVIALTVGVVCLLVSAVLLYRMVPRDGKPALDENAETLLALSQFGFMAFGLAFIAKGLL
jgi:hypothetical protein